MAKPLLETHKNIYTSHANVDRRLDRLEGRIIEKIYTMPQQEDMILNFMTQAKEKWNSLALSRLV